MKIKITHGKDGAAELPKGSRDDSLKKLKRTPSATFQQAAKIKKLRAGKLSPLKAKFKAGKLQIARKGVTIARRRGRPPSAERVKAPAAGLLLNSHLDKPQKVRRDADGAPGLAKDERAVVRQSPRRVKPVRIIPSSKRTDAAIAKQLLQRAKKGAQKKIEKEAQLQGRAAKTQVKNIRQFIMPVVSAISSRIIKTPRRFIEDEDYDPPVKVARLDPAPGARFGAAASCGSSDKSSAASQHSSQLSSDSSRSSSPSVDTSTDSQASEETQGLPEAQGAAPDAHAPLPAPQAPESDRSDRRSRRYSVSERSFGSRTTTTTAAATTAAKKLSALPSAPPPQASASPPPPLLSPPPPLQPAAGLSDPTPWLLPPTIPLASPFLPAPAAPLQGKRKSILREPTFRWTSLKHARAEPPFFSSAKYAKEGLIRKPVFDNFRPPPLTPEDVGFAAGFAAPGAAARLFSPLHAGPRFDVHKRSPLLRAPRFTPSEAHSRIFESVTLPGGRAPAASPGASSRKRKRRVFSPLRAEPRSPSHSMRTRSGRLSAADLSPLTPPPSAAAALGLAASPHAAASALNPAFTFPAHPLAPAAEAAEKAPRPRKQPGAPAEPFTAGPAPLFPWFSPGAQADRGRARDRAPEEPPRDRDAERSAEKDRSRERDREREKENKRESRKEKRRKGSEAREAAGGPALYAAAGRASKEKAAAAEEAAASSSAKKAAGRKKSSSLDPGPEVAAGALGDAPAVRTKILIKKGRGSLDRAGLDLGPAAPPEKDKEKALGLPAPGAKHAAPSIGSMLAQADKLPMTDKRVASLLKKAKAQLCKIEKSKSLKQADQPKAQVLSSVL